MQLGDMTIAEAAEFMSVSQRTVERWRLKGRGNKRLRWRWEGQVLVRKADLLAFCKVIGRGMDSDPDGIPIERA
jgi:Helix-turn-helix domain